MVKEALVINVNIQKPHNYMIFPWTSPYSETVTIWKCFLTVL